MVLMVLIGWRLLSNDCFDGWFDGFYVFLVCCIQVKQSNVMALSGLRCGGMVLQ